MGLSLTDDIRAAIKSQLTAKPEPHRRQRARKVIAGGGQKSQKCAASLWPHRSDAMGCNPEQAEQAEAILRANGCMADVDRTTGELILTSESQYKQAAKAFGMWDGKDGFGAVATSREAVRRNNEQRERIARELGR